MDIFKNCTVQGKVSCPKEQHNGSQYTILQSMGAQINCRFALLTTEHMARPCPKLRLVMFNECTGLKSLKQWVACAAVLTPA